ELADRNGRCDALRTLADGDRSDPLRAIGDAYRDARGIEEARGRVGDPLQRVFGISGRIGDGAQYFRAGVVAIAAGEPLVLPAEVDQRRRGLPLDRLVALGHSRVQPLLKLQNPAPEVGFHVLRKRGHPLAIHVARWLQPRRTKLSISPFTD